MTTTNDSGSPQRVTIREMTYGPHGVGRLPDGKAVFVRGVAAGEEVDVVVREDRKTFAYADLLAVLKSSPERVQPPCEYLPRCGGCPWQHLSYGEQLRAKEQNLRDALSRIGRIDASVVRPILASPRMFGYRQRINLRVAHDEVGFYAAASHDLVAIDHCLLAEAEVDGAIGRARDLVRLLASRVRRIEIVARGASAGVVLQAEVEGRLAPGDAQKVATFLQSAGDIGGIVLHGRQWRQSWGDVTVGVTPEDGSQLRLTAGTFNQVNPTANRLLVATVLESGGFEATDRLLELYAGAGNLTVSLAKRVGRVVAVEQDALAASAAAENCAAVGSVEIRADSARAAVENCTRHGERFDVVVLDPPRGGAAEIVQGLLRLGPERIIYVSCNPTTLARDLARLGARYRTEAVQPIDMFPHTYHVESVARIVLTC
jgi:23S rRNA (uracil1939-C5)-methyltransferase